MDTEGTQGMHGTHERRSPRTGHVPRPVGEPHGLPPKPAHAPTGGPTLADWLRVPRPTAEPGVWRPGHLPRAEEEPAVTPERALLSGAVISLLACVLVWSLLRNNYIPYWRVPPRLVTPSDWWPPLGRDPMLGTAGDVARQLYELLVVAGLLYGFGRLGNWRAAWRRLVVARSRLLQAVLAVVGALVTLALVSRDAVPLRSFVNSLLPLEGAGRERAMSLVTGAATVEYAAVVLVFLWLGLHRRATVSDRGVRREQDHRQPRIAPGSPDDPAAWPQVRAAGMGEVADQLGGEVGSGRMNDVDYARIRRAWETVQVDPSRMRAFADAVRDKGAGACVHPSGARDLPVRAARHDLLARQVLLGTVDDSERNPYARRGTRLALDPDVLGTSLLAVGPSGAGKSARLVRPVVESLALQALAGQAAVIAVGSAGSQLGPDAAYDVVVRVGDPESVYDLDLYGGTTDPDEAATLLADAFIGDISGIDVRRSATALAQLLGPFRAAYGRFPAVAELRELLEQMPVALGELRTALENDGQSAMIRELDARERQHGAPGDPGPALADRLALLDRPAFAGFFDTTGQGRPFSLRALEHPLRVRIDLPERGHADASRMLARLLLAQFNASAAARTDRSLFAFLAFDDASHTLTPETVRGVQRLRSANAGVLLTLRTLDDAPEPLRTPLLGAVGCRMAFSGVTTWDGKRFAEAWGTEWVEARDVTSRTVFADQPLTRAIHAFRKLVTGKAVTTDAVTVRQVERERWSASELAHAVPPGYAVLSLTSVRGERAAPLLVRLAGTG
ncbi:MULTISPECIES: ATP/GTP-binding protein [unclassified Streptomyces]|uniref:ATP/GTP-binding protein n=1 Tax=unclassified Streptomyces TaxID=2593676 RepID=UPI001BE8E96F|nr:MULTISPECIES: ATP/GTP-binding protein [unclassified Streptomyces]MBT2406014.1 ATP/GTP-binding protein [Streptomyces sp. ISL-21]MBT2453581.1 ATP/GTP-binding protein [Streptomyces sp. ISL-86]MBT2610616.1 ATP/GTP-binding protein [Streptomyces sp. ISL-87]